VWDRWRMARRADAVEARLEWLFDGMQAVLDGRRR
jgi:hypothetical protein